MYGWLLVRLTLSWHTGTTGGTPPSSPLREGPGQAREEDTGRERVQEGREEAQGREALTLSRAPCMHKQQLNHTFSLKALDCLLTSSGSPGETRASVVLALEIVAGMPLDWA